MRAIRTGFVVAGIGVVVSVLMATSQAGASRAVGHESQEGPAPAPAASPEVDALSLASFSDQDEQGRGDQTDTRCAGKKSACGINGRYVCCDFDTECCRRKPHKTYCAPKTDKGCFKNPSPTPPVPVPVPSPN